MMLPSGACSSAEQEESTLTWALKPVGSVLDPGLPQTLLSQVFAPL